MVFATPGGFRLRLLLGTNPNDDAANGVVFSRHLPGSQMSRVIEGLPFVFTRESKQIAERFGF